MTSTMLMSSQRLSAQASTSGRTSGSQYQRAAMQSVMLPRFAPSTQHRKQATSCSAYRGGPWGSNRTVFGPAMWGEGMMAAAQLADLAQKFANSNGSYNSCNNNGNNNNNNFDATMNAMKAFLPMDVEEQQDQYLFTADVPGLQKSDLKITVNPKERSLKISGERSRPKAVKVEGEEEKQETKFRKQFERRMGKFSRTLAGLPEDLDLSSVSARVDKGVLTITVQKVARPDYSEVFDINVE